MVLFPGGSLLLERDTAIILENPKNINYLTKLNVESGYLFITDNKTILLVDDRIFLDIKKREDIEVIRLKNFRLQLRELIEMFHVKKILLETGYVTLDRYNFYLDVLPDIEISRESFVSSAILKMRSIKTEEEIAKIKEAQRLADEAISYIINYIRVGATEKEIMVRLERKLLALGSQEKAFDFKVLAGEKTAIPHGIPSDNRVKDGDFVTIDFGATVDGYRSDMTRTFGVGKINDEQRKVYNIVLEAQKKALASLRPGEKGSSIDKIARDHIFANRYGEFFTHSLGHGVGLDIHEMPILSARSEDELEVGSVVTVEPGIYIPGKFGVRIEDMVVMRGDGPENLTKFDKELLII